MIANQLNSGTYQDLARSAISILLTVCLFAVSAPSSAAISDYITIENGTLPVVISAPHGGETAISGCPLRVNGTTVMDWNTYRLATQIQASLYAKTGKKAYLIAAKASRKYIDFNRVAADAYECSTAQPIYDAYYSALTNAVNAANVLNKAAAVLIDVHGQSTRSSTAYRGTRDGTTADNTVFYGSTPYGLLSEATFLGIQISPTSAGSRDNVNFNGGNIVYQFGRTRSPGANAVQIEFGINYRDPDSAADSTASKMADSIIAHLKRTGAL